MNFINTKNDIKKILMGLTLVFFGIFILLQSPSSPFSKMHPYADSSVFQYFAKAISQGKIPYVDMFDHKGPLLYLINMLGILAPICYGIWVVEIIFLSLTMLFSYKLCKIFFSSISSLFAVICTYSFLSIYLQGGNLTEEYSLLFMVIGLYTFARYFKDHEISNFNVIANGACFMAIVLIRLNNALFWVVFCLSVIANEIRQKKYKNISNFILYFMIGMSCVLFPIIIWLWSNGSIDAFFDSYITFNFKYSTHLSMITKWETLKFFFTTTQRLLFLLQIGLLLMEIAFKKNKRNWELIIFSILNLCSYLIVLLSISMSGKTFLHYAICILPMILLPFAYLFDSFINLILLKKIVAFVPSIIVIFVSFYIVYPNLKLNWHNTLVNHNYNNKEDLALISSIQSLTRKDDTILVLGNSCWIYNDSQRYSSSKYIYQRSIFPVDSKRKAYFDKELESSVPKLIIIPINEQYEWFSINEDEYSFYTTIGKYDIYKYSVGSDDEIE